VEYLLQNSILWTEKVKLSRIRDPLQVAILRFPEIQFIKGITTQTSRLRYYSFLTWAWQEIKKKNLLQSNKNKIYDLEKFLILISKNHHPNNYNEPNGLLDIISSKKFLEHNNTINLDDYSIGRKNQGYGNQYYKGPLATLMVIGLDENEITVSPVGKLIAKSFQKTIQSFENNFWQKKFQKNDLGKMSNACICNISNEEKEIWQRVFFGLTKRTRNGLQLSSDSKITLEDPDKLKFDFSSLDEESFKVQDVEEETEENDESIEKNSTDYSDIMRKGTLLLLLKIISAVSPSSKKQKTRQTIRDAIYYKKAYSNNIIESIDFGKLEKYRKYWEIYVHNLYYGTIFEKAFDILLKICERNPMGISTSKISNTIDTKIILKIFKKFGLENNPKLTLEEHSQILSKLLDGKSDLSNNLNEHTIIENLQTVHGNSEIFGYLALLFLFCKIRFKGFEKNSLRILSFKKSQFLSINPQSVYEISSQIKLEDFPGWLFDFVIKRHRYASAKKFINSGTKSWLFTEEEGKLLHYGKKIKFRWYRDGKWGVVLDILRDLSLVEKISVANDSFWKITKEGELWLNKIN